MNLEPHDSEVERKIRKSVVNIGEHWQHDSNFSPFFHIIRSDVLLLISFGIIPSHHFEEIFRGIEIKNKLK